MITVTVPHPTDPSYDERHGPSLWYESLSDAHYVWEKAGTDLRGFDGRRSGDCSEEVRKLIDVQNMHKVMRVLMAVNELAEAAPGEPRPASP